MNKRTQRKFRHNRIRSKVKGTAQVPRMNVFRSLSQIYVQFIDDENGKTMARAGSSELKGKNSKKQASVEVGKLAAQKAQAAGIKKVVFDRGGYQYHGRVKELADSARAAGLEF